MLINSALMNVKIPVAFVSSLLRSFELTEEAVALVE